MTEQEWLTSKNLGELIYFLPAKPERKWLMFAVACCQPIMYLLHDNRSRNAIELVERIAEGEANCNELEEAHQAACDALADSKPERKRWPGLAEIARVIAIPNRHAKESSQGTAGWVVSAIGQRAMQATVEKNRRHQRLAQRAAWEGETARQCNLLRDLFGNPFCPATIDSSWLAWNNATIPELAQAIYDQRAFDRLPILADALEVAGCTNADILAHCRQPGPHVRGCWVLDLLLGKA